MFRQSEESVKTSQADAPANEFSPDERRLLLRLAHEVIASSLDFDRASQRVSLDPPTSHLAEPRGAFTTLYRHSKLRGCVGQVMAFASVYRTVAETAMAAASQDTRFEPVRREELADLEISLSILSPLRPIKPEELEVGRHGLLISQSGYRGLLLPQVPVEHGWDRITFLQHTCLKAGLPPDAWRSGATLEAFTAEVFGDADQAM